ncbi:MAG TPA: hypothetical protein VLX61_09020 [Anaerolineales bacterium]|nr:hypothetical protein [Anaerolineales bacterium]
MTPQQGFRRVFLTALKHTLNPVTRRIAHSSFGPFAVVKHVGRRSGKVYETPIIARLTEDGFVIELTYGQDVDWHKNVLAAGGCTMIWHRKEYRIDQLEPLDAETGRAAFSPLQRFVLGVLRRHEFEKLRFQSVERKT